MMVRATLAVLTVLGLLFGTMAFNPSQCGECPGNFTLLGSEAAIDLGGGAQACTWMCQCTRTYSSKFLIFMFIH